ncbi:ammonium transporter [Pelotomaculum terephthalicicum JT]|uniref:ammonium transporter n=1 Tax=Pelotomaculum TaxID=191373 RepID=UPI0009D54854|nr:MULTISPECIES: ammonium transporter [Pelotomaculum]MCG9966709.1 ammonium transporter [Pelotomaculum terephthalicicum JT]OPX91432.1 MAG: Ammonium transporter NrgA [Pelotomaculum sp. PtaB.Bin117]OPY62968.1 MAG: Ammonium transporter NrgA [Pelotomaculum sp. PtaU1.Bin065]
MAEINIQDLASGVDTIWVLLCAALVFFMEGGFAFLEAGFIRAKNSMNIVMKVFTDSTIGMLSYWAIGFGIMYGLDRAGVFGSSGFLIGGDLSHIQLRIPIYAYWLFQAAFAMAMASIVSGAVAERMKYGPYIIYTAVATALIYPIAGHWVWGVNGWLGKLGMLDFAGSAVVHAVGGWSALAAVLVLGPRTGKYNKDGTLNVLPAHNLHLAFLGTFILWFGWFGFNPGSSLSGLDMNIARIALTTNLAAAAGGTAGILFTMFKYGKADPSMAMNGALAGLAAITAGTAYVQPASAVIIGGVAGVLVVLAVSFFDKIKADDPVGAIAVHGAGGTWGVLAVGLFAQQGGLFYGGGAEFLGVQALGVLSVSVWAFTATYLVFTLLKKTVGVRVSAQEEFEGLDLNEHGITAYTGLMTNPLYDVEENPAHAFGGMQPQKTLAVNSAPNIKP